MLNLNFPGKVQTPSPPSPKVKKIRACTVINLWVDSGNILSIRLNPKLHTAQTGSHKRELGWRKHGLREIWASFALCTDASIYYSFYCVQQRAGCFITYFIFHQVNVLFFISSCVYMFTGISSVIRGLDHSVTECVRGRWDVPICQVYVEVY